MNTQEAVKKWKELGISSAEFEFNCGGDSMNDTTINFYDNKSKIIQSKELEDYFDSVIYDRVEFYVNSDGHYQGEFGVVHIKLDDESDDVEEHDFTYSKESQAEYNEQFTEIGEVELTAEQIAFIEKNVSNINGGDSDSGNINYKRDFIMTDEDERIEAELCELITDYAEGYGFENASGEANDWWGFSTNSEDSDKLTELTIENGCLKVEIRRTFVIYQDSNW